MRAAVWVGFLLLVSVFPSSAQADKCDLFGYLESQLGVGTLDGRFYQMSTNKLRVDLETEVSDKVVFGANFDYLTYHGQTRWNVLDYLPQRIGGTVPEENRSAFEFTYDDRSFLDNAYMKIEFDKFDLTVGKQQLSFGTGYVWNPVDILNVKDFADPTYEQRGHNAVRFEIPIGQRHSIDLVYLPGEVVKDSTKILRTKVGIWRFDFTGTLADTLYRSMDYMTPLPIEDRRRIVGFEFVGELLTVGVLGEFAYSLMDQIDDFLEAVVGLNYTFDTGTYVMAEFYHNSSRPNNSEDYTLNDWMEYLSGTSKAMSRDQLYLMMSHSLTDLLNASLSAVGSLSDRSGAIIPMVEYSIFENVEITAYGSFYLGGEGKSYSKDFGQSAIIRTRVFF